MMDWDELLTWLRSTSPDQAALATELDASTHRLVDEGLLAPLEKARISDAQAFSTSAHAGQFRADGRPYVTHPMRVALVCIAFASRQKDNTACLLMTQVALLHDVLEDTKVSQQELTVSFGSDVAESVRCLTASPADVETIDDRMNRKTKKWMRVAAAGRVIRIVHCADVCDNLIAARSLFAQAANPSALKVARWLMQARDYQLPIAKATGASFAQVIEEELQYAESQGIVPGTWAGDSPRSGSS